MKLRCDSFHNDYILTLKNHLSYLIELGNDIYGIWCLQRSSETEGTFGDIKTNQGYGRLRRRGENGVKEEILLVGIGHNLRKYHRYKQRIRKKINKLEI